jgi:type IV secretory pathway VirB2 component (pilin)
MRLSQNMSTQPLACVIAVSMHLSIKPTHPTPAKHKATARPLTNQILLMTQRGNPEQEQ